MKCEKCGKAFNIGDRIVQKAHMKIISEDKFDNVSDVEWGDCYCEDCAETL